MGHPVNNKKSIVERLDLLQIESGLSEKAFKNTLATITGKTPRTIRRWYSLESNIHENDIELISKYFGEHTHWLRYGNQNDQLTAVDQIMNSDHFGAVILKNDKVEEVNFKFLEMMNINENDIRKQDICDHILQFQTEETVSKCKKGHDNAITKGANIDRLMMVLGDGQQHYIESTTLNINNGRVLRILFDQGFVKDAEKIQQDSTKTSLTKKGNHKSLKILFVDDDITNCQLYNSMLSIHGYQVNAFNSSLHALNEFRQHHQNYDLIIADVIMPDMTGDELVNACREIRSDMPVILCSGYAEHLNKSTAEEFGVSHFLQKPIDSNELLKLLETLI